MPKPRCGRTLHQIWVCSTIELGPEQEVDVVRVGLPAPEVVRDSAAREHPREDLRARRVQAAEAALHERRSSPTRPAARAARAAARRTTATARSAPRMPTCTWLLKVLLRHATYLQLLLDAPVVRRVDDALLLPRAPRMRARSPRAPRRALGQREQPAAALVLALERVGEVRALAGADLDLRGDQLAGDRVGQHVVARRASSCRPSNTLTSDSVSGSSSANSSSSPTVKSVEDSKTSRAAVHRRRSREP